MTDILTNLLQNLSHPQQMLLNFGPTAAYAILFIIIFAESGLLIGFFLPGDSLLIGAGILAGVKYDQTTFFNIAVIILLSITAAIVGDTVGYLTGKNFGSKLFSQQDSLFFHKKHLESAQTFYDQKGKSTIILARFIPIIRTFAPITAGMAQMKWLDFAKYNIVGATLWCLIFILGGYFLGSWLGDVDKYLSWIIFGVVAISVLPAVYHVWKESRKTA